jgi:hypothetical protein
MFISISRGIISAVLSVLLVIFSFNFVQRDINILATRTLSRQIFDYVFNFLIFFIVIYLVITLGTYLIKKIFPKSK